ncbi:hypothetical protein EDB84DRAFT_1476191 [Lactarius hengduanensis]|nr:hypothetical protein EDB84DRAFT_1476191 [Lactarius hengduanensis]
MWVLICLYLGLYGLCQTLFTSMKVLLTSASGVGQFSTFLVAVRHSQHARTTQLASESCSFFFLTIALATSPISAVALSLHGLFSPVAPPLPINITHPKLSTIEHKDS